MKLRNKKTGEILELCCHRSGDYREKYDSLAELNEEWEDYEEPKTYWHIDDMNLLEIAHATHECYIDDFREAIGNYFETKEEAKKAIEKLKAWKRLKDAGVSFKPTTIGHKWYLEPHASPENRTFKESHDSYKDVMLFFGGEDDKK